MTNGILYISGVLTEDTKIQSRKIHNKEFSECYIVDKNPLQEQIKEYYGKTSKLERDLYIESEYESHIQQLIKDGYISNNTFDEDRQGRIDELIEEFPDRRKEIIDTMLKNDQDPSHETVRDNNSTIMGLVDNARKSPTPLSSETQNNRI